MPIKNVKVGILIKGEKMSFDVELDDDLDLDVLTQDIVVSDANMYIADEDKAVELISELIKNKTDDSISFRKQMENKINYIFSLFSEVTIENEKLKLLSQVQTEKEMQTAPWLRSIRLDTFSMDQDKTIYNTESQKRRNTDLIKRSRFYQGVIDSSLLAPGTRSFNLLNDTCIIMITPFDLFGKGRYCYTFHPYCEEEPDLRLEDGAVRIFLNSHGTNRNEVSELILIVQPPYS